MNKSKMVMTNGTKQPRILLSLCLGLYLLVRGKYFCENMANSDNNHLDTYNKRIK